MINLVMEIFFLCKCILGGVMYENNGGGLKFEFVLVLELWVLF